MANLVINAYFGYRPGTAPRLLRPGQAVQAVNADLRDGNLVAFGGLMQEATLTKAGTLQTLFRWGSTWFSWTQDVDVVLGPVANDTENRVYWTGEGAPKMSYAGLATGGGGTDYPTGSYDIGVPAPTSAITATVTGTATDPNSTPEYRTYVETFLSAKGEEGPPSPISAQVTWRDGQSVDLTNLNPNPGGNRNLNRRRIYRTDVGATAAEFQLVDTIDIATTTYTDTVATTNLGDVLASAEWDPPPSDLAGLTAMPNGILAGFRNNEVCFCEPFLPHAWPVAYRQQSTDDIVGLGAFGNTLLAATTSYPLLLSGAHPASMGMVKGEVPFPCVAKRALVDLGYSIIYPGPKGPVVGDTNGMRLLEGIWTPDQWAALNPTSMHAYRLFDRWLVFYDNGTPGAFLLDPAGQRLTDIDLGATVTAGWTAPDTGTFYAVVGSDVQSFGAGAALTARWRSGEVLMPHPVNLGFGQLEADAYPVTLRLYGDGALQVTQSVVSSRVFVLPLGYEARSYEVELEGTASIGRLKLAESAEELNSL